MSPSFAFAEVCEMEIFEEPNKSTSVELDEVKVKGSVKNGIKGTAWDIPESHDPNNYQSAKDLVSEGGIPVGLIFQDESRSSFDEHLSSLSNSDKPSNVQKMIDSYSL